MTLPGFSEWHIDNNNTSRSEAPLPWSVEVATHFDHENRLTTGVERWNYSHAIIQLGNFRIFSTGRYTKAGDEDALAELVRDTISDFGNAVNKAIRHARG